MTFTFDGLVGHDLNVIACSSSSRLLSSLLRGGRSGGGGRILLNAVLFCVGQTFDISFDLPSYATKHRCVGQQARFGLFYV